MTNEPLSGAAETAPQSRKEALLKALAGIAEDPRSRLQRKPDGKPARKAGPEMKMVEETISVDTTDAGVAAKLAVYKVLETPLPLAPAGSSEQLDNLIASAPHAEEILRKIELDIAFAKRLGAKRAPQQRLMLVGPPGCGKTFLARSMMSIITGGHLMYSAAAANSAIDIVGQPAAFRVSDAGLPVRAMARTRLANPGIVVDELDKAGSSDWNGSAKMAFLPYNEAETSRRLFDPYIQVHVNCSEVHWIFTVNDLGAVPEPLCSRLDIHELKPPGVECLAPILKGFAADLAGRFGVRISQIPVVDDLLRLKLEREFKHGVDLRRLRRLYEQEIKHRSVASGRRASASAQPPRL